MRPGDETGTQTGAADRGRQGVRDGPAGQQGTGRRAGGRPTRNGGNGAGRSRAGGWGGVRCGGLAAVGIETSWRVSV
jgi:hypothetical protein